MHEFVFLVDGKLVTVHSWEDVPERFDNVIKFLPSIPPEPHTEEQHEEIESWNSKLQELIEREHASSN